MRIVIIGHTGFIGLNNKVKSREHTKEKVDHHFSNELIHNLLGDIRFTSLEDGLRKMHKSIINKIKVS